MAVDNDKRRAIRSFLEDGERASEHFQIIGVADSSHIPAISKKARCNIITERYIGMALNSDAVVVVDPAQVVELKMASQRRGFVGNAFHHASISAQSVDAVCEQL